MSSSWSAGGPGLICPSCSRSHFPFCGRDHHAIGHAGFPPYAQGRGLSPLPMPPLHPLQPMVGPLGQPFYRPPSPLRNTNVLGHLGPPLNVRHEGFFEEQQPGLRPFRGPMHHDNIRPGLGFPLPLPHDTHDFDRFRPSAGGHTGRPGINVANNWLVEEERERERQREREMWLLEHQRNDLILKPDRLGAVDRHPLDLIPTSFVRPGNALGEAHELWMRGDGQARLDEYHVYRGSHRVQSGHNEKGREYDVLPGVLRGGHQSSGPFEGSEAAEGGHRSSYPFEGFEPTQGGHQSVAHFEGFEPMQGGHQILARFEGFKSTQGGHQSSARFEGFEPTQGVPRGTTAPFERENEAVEFADRIARPMNKDSGIGMQWHGEYRDFHVGQFDFPQGARKRTMMDVGEDVQDPRVGGFFGTTIDGIDKRFLGKQSPHHPVSSECQQSMHSLNYDSGNRAGAFGMEQMKKDGITSNKRQRVVSREEELLMEHGLLDDSQDIKNDGPFTSETLSDDKTLSQDGRHHFGLLLTGRRNNDDVRHSQSASEAKTFIQKFQPAKDEDTYNGNALEMGYLINPSQDTLHGNVFMGARDQKSDVPLHSLGSQRDLLQGRSVESGSFWDKKSNDRYSVLSNDRFGSHESRPAFHATRDSYHMSMQQSTEVPILTEGERVHQSDSSRAGRFEEHRLSGGSAIQKFSQLRPESMREWHQEESLRAIEELHMDFVHQQQQKMHKQTHFQPAQSQEETFRLDEGSNVLSQAHQPHLQAISRSQIEVQRQVAKPSSQDQSSYNQVQQLQSTQLSDSGTNQDQNECNTRRGESMLNPYGDGMHQRNLQAQHQRSQPFQHLNSQSDMNSKKNNYLFAPVHNYEHFQHSPPHHMVQEHNLKMHEQQQQRPHQSEQRLHQSEQQELQLMPNQASQNFPLSQQDQLKLQQQRGLSQLPQQQFQRHLQSQEQHHLPSNQLTYEKQNPSEWDYQRQQEGNQEAGKLYQFEVNDSNHRQRNFKSNPSIQLPPQFPQQPEQYGHLHGHKQQTEIEQAEQKSQYIITARGPEISHPNMHGSYELRPDCGGVPPVMQISATMPQGQNLSQQPQAFTLCPPVPSLPPPPLPPSPPSSPSHAPPPPPPPPASPPKSSASANFSSGAAGTHSLPTSMRSFPDIKPSAHGYQYLPAPSHNGPGFTGVGSQGMHHMPYKQFGDPGQRFPPKLTQEDRPKVVDAIHIFKQPGRTNRPDRFVVILRGLPGSGKSYLAKVLRDVEVMNGGSAPRIHSMDDYFMTEVEKDDDNDNGSATSTLLRSKKRVTKKVMEYCYEPDMEEAYRASMLKAFKKTLEEGIFTFIIVDDRNLRVADFAQFWAVAKRSGYEVYLLEAPYKDPAGCAVRNVHDFTAEKVQEMAKCWEPAPPLYLQLDISALFHGDDLNAQNITEVEMDTDDTEQDVEYQGGLPRTESGKTDSPSEFSLQNGVVSHGDRWGLEKLNDREEAKDLTRSKWSDDHEDGNDTNAKDVENIDCNALSGLMQAYGKGDRRMRWADQAGSGFSIGRVPQNKCSLIIGPGAGYNEASNPLPDEEKNNIEHESFPGGQSKRNAKILEQLRAEQETFRAVFDRRRHRIAVMDEDDE